MLFLVVGFAEMLKVRNKQQQQHQQTKLINNDVSANKVDLFFLVVLKITHTEHTNNASCHQWWLWYTS